MKHLYLAAAVTAVVLFSIAAALIITAAVGSARPTGCWTVTDVTGRETTFETAPSFDLNVRAIKWEDGNRAGWIFPARVEQDLLCSGTLAP